MIIFGIMLMHDLLSVDRQEKHVKFDRALVAFMLYFISDLFSVAVDYNIITKTKTLVVLFGFSNCVMMVGITYMWLGFVKKTDRLTF